MSFNSKLAQSIQSDYRHDAAIEREYGSRFSFRGAIVKLAITVVGLVIVANVLLQVAAS